MPTTSNARRILAPLVGAGLGAAISFGAVSYAQSPSSANPAKNAPTQSAQGPILPKVHDLLESLVANGTINQSQADAVESQAAAGSINPKTLVDNHVLTQAQMLTVAKGIDAIKQSFRAAGSS
jgi:hypothetical protein